MNPPLADVCALLRLRVMREEAAQRALAACAEEVAACRQVVERRLAQVARVRRSRIELMDWLSGPGAAAAPRTGACAAAHREALDDELEQAQAELVDERDELDAALQRLDAARQAWLRERSRQQAVQQLEADTRRALARAQEERSESEAEPRSPLEV